MTPLLNPITQAEQLYNESQIRTRNPIERTFGVLKRRFPILALGIRLKITKVEKLVVATAVLHNIAINMKDVLPPINQEIEAAIQFLENMNVENNLNNYGHLVDMRGRRLNEHEIIRAGLINEYFQNMIVR